MDYILIVYDQVHALYRLENKVNDGGGHVQMWQMQITSQNLLSQITAYETSNNGMGLRALDC